MKTIAVFIFYRFVIPEQIAGQHQDVVKIDRISLEKFFFIFSYISTSLKGPMRRQVSK
jgi:hypothetical protein